MKMMGTTAPLGMLMMLMMVLLTLTHVLGVKGQHDVSTHPFGKGQSEKNPKDSRTDLPPAPLSEASSTPETDCHPVWTHQTTSTPNLNPLLAYHASFYKKCVPGVQFRDWRSDDLRKYTGSSRDPRTKKTAKTVQEELLQCDRDSCSKSQAEDSCQKPHTGGDDVRLKLSNGGDSSEKLKQDDESEIRTRPSIQPASRPIPETSFYSAKPEVDISLTSSDFELVSEHEDGITTVVCLDDQVSPGDENDDSEEFIPPTPAGGFDAKRDTGDDTTTDSSAQAPTSADVTNMAPEDSSTGGSEVEDHHHHHHSAWSSGGWECEWCFGLVISVLVVLGVSFGVCYAICYLRRGRRLTPDDRDIWMQEAWS